MGLLKNRSYCLSQFSKPKDIDEFYTTMEEVEYIFDHLTEDFTNKIIYCPFDSEESNFVKYIKLHNNELKYKDFWYTSDDWYTHLDLIEKADYIISNPPFSEMIYHNKKELGILDIMSQKKCKFFLFGGTLSIMAYKKRLFETNTKFYRRKFINFILPNGKLKSNSSAHYITNLNNSFEQRKLKLTKSFNKLDTYIAKTEKQFGLYIGKIKDIPYDYDDWMFVPMTICFNDDDRIIYDKEQIFNLHKGTYRYILNSPDGKVPYIHARIKIDINKNIKD